MEFLALFDAEGRRQTSVPRDDAEAYGGEEKLLAEGYVVISEDDFNYYIGNCGNGDNGTGYIRDLITGKPISAPPPPLPPVEEVAAEKWKEIKEARDAAEQSGCPYMGKVLDSDSISVQRINTAVQAAQVAATQKQDFAIDWTMQDNTIVTMSIADVLGMPVALATYSNALHEKARSLRERLEQTITDYKSGVCTEADARGGIQEIRWEG